MDVFWLCDGKLEHHEPGELAELRARGDGFLWVDIPECHDEAVRVLTEEFRFHPLAVRDCRERTPIPKLRTYGDHLFVILHAPQLGHAGEVHLLELDYFAGHRYLVTVHGPVNPDVSRDTALRETRAVVKRIEGGRFFPATPAELSHAIVSAFAARQEALVAELARKVAGLERLVLGDEERSPGGALEQMFRVRHELLTVRTMAAGCRETYARMSALSRFLPPEAQPFIEDLVDQFERVRSLCDGEKEFLQGVVDFYQSRTTVKINIAMERLALISAVILPLTLVAGIYGMNIIVPDETNPLHVGAVVVAMAAIAFGMFQWAKRQGWW